MRSRPKVILLDLDDTLIHLGCTPEEAWEKCCLDFAGSGSLPVGVTALLNSVNAARKWYWNDPERHKHGRSDMRASRREVVALALQALGIVEETMSNALADSFSAYSDRLTCLFPNTADTLEKLRKAGVRLGLLTNGASGTQRAKIDRFDLAQYFEHILIEGELGFGKPDERVYKAALSLFGALPGDCWMAGDNLVWDVAAPQALGILAIWYDKNGTGLPGDAPVIPDRVIRDISELLKLLK
jgi:putative hydrolase of the HAD superfamily